MATTIKLKNGTGVPSAGSLVVGEPALDLTNKRLYTEDSGGTVIEVGTNPTSVTTGTFTSTGIDDNAASTAITIDGSQNVGIGTSSSSVKLHVASTGRDVAIIESTDAGALNGPYLNLYRNSVSPAANDYLGFLQFSGENSSGSAVDYAFIGAQATQVTTSPAQKGDLAFFTANEASPVERMRIDASGRVGIGTSNPAAPLSVEGSGGLVANINDTNANGGYVRFQNSGTSIGDIGAGAQVLSGGTAGDFGITSRSGNLVFGTGTAERMRLDSSGNLLVGTTDDVVQTNSGTGNGGIVLRNNNYVAVASDGSAALELNRLASDGEIANFRKDGTTVGSIGAVASQLYIAGGDTGLQLNGTADQIRPCDGSGAARDAAIDLGDATRRFKDLYLSGGAYLGGTGSANHLDDYEEGTWTPIVTGSGTQGSYTYNTNGNYYTKVGRLITLHFDITNITQVTAGSGYLQISGAPFDKSSGHVAAGVAYLQDLDWSNSGTYGITQFITSSQTSVLYVRILGDNYGGQDLQMSAINSGSSDIIGSITYLV